MRCLMPLAPCFISLITAAPTLEKRASPTVSLDYATIVGSSLLGIDSFKGIPYAQPPVGSLRLKPPQPITSNLGTIQATGTPRACPQFLTSTNTSAIPNDVITEVLDTGFLQALTDTGEDCLTVNLQRPSSASAGSKLPVVFWMFGGAFEFGSTQTYDASELITTSVTQGKDIIYVSVNYRLGGFGFLPGAEILKDGSANLGHLDQRLGLKWVADNIAKFGGDPSKVTIWGESAGSISVFNQMSLYNGNNTYKGQPLFRAAVMDSGSVVPADPVDYPKGQSIYDTVVAHAGCGAASDTLACLRTVDYETYLQATTSVPCFTDYQSVALSYLPRPDGVALTQSAEILAQNGQYAKVPFIIGDQEDEGTLFSLVQSNISTTEQLVDYLKTIYFADATIEQVQDLVATYPDDPSAGSPFNTGLLNNIYPQYKRIAAILGDLTFTLTRRVFLNIASSVNPSIPTWSYLASYGYGTPILGTFHASDILTTYGITPDFASATIQSFYLSFFNTMDPNDGTVGLPTWPKWSQGNQLMNFQAVSNTLLADTFRNDSYAFIAAAKSSLHI
ncbi:cholinesterase [Mollisia scopiformis]|uniref:Carboxylic ester hydrolase n=1 Tax=Mollisia scopiformis TaxID=149040 RepID=A0A194XCS2_MOLSC|nr:cholinesterase [Mollisia scopiformis]KUJ17951.1 cholinesterase [Mollisia scopiformis]